MTLAVHSRALRKNCAISSKPCVPSLSSTLAPYYVLMASMDTSDQKEPIRVLIIDDDEDDSLLVRSCLAQIGRYHVEWAADFDAGVAALVRCEHDVCLLDYKLGAHSGLDLLRHEVAAQCLKPSILLTGYEDRASDLEAMRAGAVDYLPKSRIDDGITLERVIRYALERARVLEKLHQNEERLADLLQQAERTRDDLLSLLERLRLASVMIDEEGRISFASRVASELLGRPPDRLQGQPWQEIFAFSDDFSEVLTMFRKPASQRQTVLLRGNLASSRDSFIEVDIEDDPRTSERKILLLQDVTEVHRLRQLVKGKASFHNMVGRSDAMQEIFERIRAISAVDTTVLVTGETGTGKELVARSLHELSNRREMPFVAINCAGLTESLLASQLFGHKRGAFTGATQDHRGYFETAAGGTLFLDEIGDISSAVQQSLLRVLQEREIIRVGDSKPRSVDVRIITATHRDLHGEVERGRFRADLLYRIQVARVAIPPLRQRREDIPLLTETFLTEHRTVMGKTTDRVETKVMRLLLAYPWPGNVRELRSAIEYAMISCKGATIRVSDLPPEIMNNDKRPMPSDGLSSQDEESRIREALEIADGNRTRAAHLLGVARATLYRRMNALGMSRSKK